MLAQEGAVVHHLLQQTLFARMGVQPSRRQHETEIRLRVSGQTAVLALLRQLCPQPFFRVRGQLFVMLQISAGQRTLRQLGIHRGACCQRAKPFQRFRRGAFQTNMFRGKWRQGLSGQGCAGKHGFQRHDGSSQFSSNVHVHPILL